MELNSLERAPEKLVELNSLELDSLVMEAEDDPQVMEAGEDPQARDALGGLDQLLSYCVRRLDTMVQVGTGRALLGR